MKFRCSESFIRKYIVNILDWSWRATIRAAQKLPEDVDKILEEAYLREAYVIWNYTTVYQHGNKATWHKHGDKQVGVVGKDEKRVFTLVPSISASGEVLPFQAIFQGGTAASCPSKDSPYYDEAMKLGFKLEPSKSSTYWSTLDTMKSLVNDIIRPYLEQKKQDLEIEDPKEQRSIWKIDCWSVHKSEAFLSWMKKTHPTIIVIFIPGNCTSVFQPLDVGVQRVLKQSFKWSSHADIVGEVSKKLATGGSITLDMSLPVLRDRALGWIVKAYHDINKPHLIKKVV
ncbi:hypothetical protein K435DRAFT_820162 [Dendrothele bispora CBS 962.96]|uniref:DDE-1 domain-containing protein n=1 Tax=Dendrothele bispora (strain CBS 962.96) TaxID=1314807 RepID=A0A4S8LW31_DENBC|nr:hypothetical protein K435DRAFT_820162 [Dendrothele bispora CBS 962.96]